MKPMYQGESLWPPMKILTENEFDSLPDDAKMNGIYAIVPTNGVDTYGCSNLYSQEETVVGRWVDGKPVYQKAVIIEKGAANGALIANDVEMAIDAHGLGISSTSGLTMNIPYYITDGDRFSLTNSNGALKIVAPRFTGYKTILTVRYTKTTDYGEEEG